MSLQSFLLFTKSEIKKKKIEFNEREIDVLCMHAASIVRFYQTKTDNENEEIQKLKLDNIYTYTGNKLRGELSEISLKIIKSRSVEQFPLQIFLSSLPINSHKSYEKWLLLQARILIVCHHFYTQKGYKEIIIRVMANYRSLVKYNDSDLVMSMPNSALELEYLIEKLRLIKQKLNPPNSNITRIGDYIHLLSEYKDKKTHYIKRNINRGSESHEKPEIKNILSKFIHEEGDNNISEITQPIMANEKYGYNYLERTSEQTSTARYFSVDLVAPSEVKRSLTRQNTLANASINQLLRREKYLASDVNQLTSYEVSIIMNDCLKPNVLSIESTYIYLSLAVGRSLEQIFSSKFILKKAVEPPFDNRILVKFNPLLPKHKLPLKVSKLINPSSGSVLIVLPKHLGEAVEMILSKSQDFDVIKKNISNKITQLNSKYGCKITQARIANYLATFLQQNGIDGVETSMLLGWEPKQVSGSYYYQVSNERLLLLHQKYTAFLYEITGKEYADIVLSKENLENDNSEVVYAGSKLQMKDVCITKLFSLLDSHLLKIKEDLYDFHNLYTIYTLLLLNLAVGHRPVNNPYESSEIFDCYAGTVFICDKESRSDLSARVLVLPELAQEQINNYLLHLKSVSQYFANISPDKEEQIKGAIDGSQPLFIFIDELNIIPVTPSNLEGKLKPVLPIPLNWHRHYMRTTLRHLGVSGQMVDLWMGHLGIGNTNMSTFSALAMSDLRQIANKINNHMKNVLGIFALKGL